MKKLVFVLVVLIFVFSAACTSNEKINDNSNYSSVSQEANKTAAPIQSAAQIPEVNETPSPVSSAAPTQAPSSAPDDNQDDDKMPNVYTELINKYSNALSKKMNPGSLIQNDMSLLMAECYGENPYDNIGYLVNDLDNNGTLDLMIAVTDKISDDFYGKIVFDLYTIDDNGAAIKVFDSNERNRFYYAGNNQFANIGASSADDNVSTCVELNGTKAVDMKTTISPDKYVQAELDSFAK